MEAWRNSDKQKQTVDILFREKRYNKTSYMIKKMWNYRKDLLRPP